MECPLPFLFLSKSSKGSCTRNDSISGKSCVMYKKFSDKINLHAYKALHFCKKVYLKEYVCKDIPPHFLWKHSPKHYFTKARFPT